MSDHDPPPRISTSSDSEDSTRDSSTSDPPTMPTHLDRHPFAEFYYHRNPRRHSTSDPIKDLSDSTTLENIHRFRNLSIQWMKVSPGYRGNVGKVQDRTLIMATTTNKPSTPYAIYIIKEILRDSAVLIPHNREIVANDRPDLFMPLITKHSRDLENIGSIFINNYLPGDAVLVTLMEPLSRCSKMNRDMDEALDFDRNSFWMVKEFRLLKRKFMDNTLITKIDESRRRGSDRESDKPKPKHFKELFVAMNLNIPVQIKLEAFEQIGLDRINLAKIFKPHLQPEQFLTSLIPEHRILVASETQSHCPGHQVWPLVVEVSKLPPILEHELDQATNIFSRLPPDEPRGYEIGLMIGLFGRSGELAMENRSLDLQVYPTKIGRVILASEDPKVEFSIKKFGGPAPIKRWTRKVLFHLVTPSGAKFEMGVDKSEQSGAQISIKAYLNSSKPEDRASISELEGQNVVIYQQIHENQHHLKCFPGMKALRDAPMDAPIKQCLVAMLGGSRLPELGEVDVGRVEKELEAYFGAKEVRLSRAQLEAPRASGALADGLKVRMAADPAAMRVGFGLSLTGPMPTEGSPGTDNLAEGSRAFGALTPGLDANMDVDRPPTDEVPGLSLTGPAAMVEGATKPNLILKADPTHLPGASGTLIPDLEARQNLVDVDPVAMDRGLTGPVALTKRASDPYFLIPETTPAKVPRASGTLATDPDARKHLVAEEDDPAAKRLCLGLSRPQPFPSIDATKPLIPEAAPTQAPHAYGALAHEVGDTDGSDASQVATVGATANPAEVPRASITLSRDQLTFLGAILHSKTAAVTVDGCFRSGKSLAIVLAANLQATSDPAGIQIVTANTNYGVATLVKKHLSLLKKEKAVRMISLPFYESVNKEAKTDIDFPKLWVEVLKERVDADLEGDDEDDYQDYTTDSYDITESALYHLVTQGHMDLPPDRSLPAKPTHDLVETFLAIYQPRIIFGTVSTLTESFFSRTLGRMEVQTIFFDDANQLSYHDFSGLATYCSNAKLALLGDFKQLPPFVDKHLPGILEEYGVGRLFKKAMAQFPCLKFSEAYDAPKGIVDICAKLVYGWEHRISLGSVGSRSFLSGIFGSDFPIKVLDVKGAHEQSGTSLINKYEYEIVNSLVRWLRSLHPNASIGVLSYYKAQSGETSQISETHDIFIGTVDCCQGRSFDHVILLTTKQFKFRPSDFLADPNRLNLALSRAKGLCFLVTDVGAAEDYEIWGELFKEIPEDQFRDALSVTKDLK